MKPLQEEELDRLLGLLRVAALPAGFQERVLQRAYAQPQQRSVCVALKAWLDELVGDIFGHSGDLPLYNIKWRLGGAFAALVLSFSAGYYVNGLLPGEEDNGLSLYALDEPESMDAI